MARLALENPRSLEFPRVHRTLELDGCGTMGCNALATICLHWNSPVDTTSGDPQQSGDERGEVIPSVDETEAWWEAGLLDPSEGFGRWRQQERPGMSQGVFGHGTSSSSGMSVEMSTYWHFCGFWTLDGLSMASGERQEVLDMLPLFQKPIPAVSDLLSSVVLIGSALAPGLGAAGISGSGPVDPSFSLSHLVSVHKICSFCLFLVLAPLVDIRPW